MANPKFCDDLRRSVKLTEKQRAAISGMILGDGSLVETFSKKNLRLQIEQCEAQVAYVFWKYQMLSPLVLTPPKFRIRTRSWRFRTISHPDLTEFGRLFYADRRKIVPDRINGLLKEPLTLAVWCMDDGSKFRDNALILNTQCFTKRDVESLRDCLGKNFGLKHVTLQRDKKGWRLYIFKESAKRMAEIIRPYVLPEMMYKMISPVETTRWPLHGQTQGEDIVHAA